MLCLSWSPVSAILVEKWLFGESRSLDKRQWRVWSVSVIQS